MPYEQTVKLHEIASETRFKELYVVKGGTHGDSFLKEPREYLMKMEKFIRKCILEYEPIWADEWYSDQKEQGEGESSARRK